MTELEFSMHDKSFDDSGQLLPCNTISDGLKIEKVTFMITIVSQFDFQIVEHTFIVIKR